MIRSALRLHMPESVDEATSLLGVPSTAVLGGGTMLIPLLSRGARECDHVIVLSRLGLDEIAVETNGDLLIGAQVSYSQVIASPDCADHTPLLVDVARKITGGAQVRNRGTLVGSACYANPGSDAPAALVSLGAVVRICGPEGARDLAAEQFFVGAFETALRPGEFVTHVRVPAQDGRRHAFGKVKLCEGSWPIVSVVAMFAPDGAAQLTVGGACTRPIVIRGLNDAEHAAARVAMAFEEMWGDELAPAPYRRTVAPRYAQQVLTKLLEGVHLE